MTLVKKKNKILNFYDEIINKARSVDSMTSEGILNKLIIRKNKKGDAFNYIIAYDGNGNKETVIYSLVNKQKNWIMHSKLNLITPVTKGYSKGY